MKKLSACLAAAAMGCLAWHAGAQNANQTVNSLLSTDLIQINRGNSGAIFYATPATLAAAGRVPILVPIRTVIASGPITVSKTTDYFICVNLTTPAAIAVNLPATPATGLTFLIKDCSGTAATDNLTLTPAAGNIDGATTYVMSTNYASVAVTYNGVSWSVN